MNSQSNLKSEKQRQRYHAPWTPTMPQTYSDQNSMVSAQNTHTAQRNRSRNPKINPHKNGQLIYKKGAPTLHNSTDETGEHYAKWNKPGGKRQIPYCLTFNRNLINKTNKQTSKI